MNTSLTLARLILTGQHDHPVLRVPAGVQRYGLQGEVGVGDLLPGQLMVIAVLVDHHRPALGHRDTYQHKPVLGADLAEVAGHSVHHPF